LFLGILKLMVGLLVSCTVHGGTSVMAFLRQRCGTTPKWVVARVLAALSRRRVNPAGVIGKNRAISALQNRRHVIR
jgi:hypothetical protein